MQGIIIKIMEQTPSWRIQRIFFSTYLFISVLFTLLSLEPRSCTAQQTHESSTMATDTMSTGNDHMMMDSMTEMTSDMMATDGQRPMMTSEMMHSDENTMTTMMMTADDQHMMSTEEMTSDSDPMMTMTTMTATEETEDDDHNLSGITAINVHHTMATDETMNTMMHSNMTMDEEINDTSNTTMPPSMTMEMTTGTMTEEPGAHIMNESMTIRMNMDNMTHQDQHGHSSMTTMGMTSTPRIHHSSPAMALTCFSCQTTSMTSVCYDMQNDTSPVVTCAAGEMCGTVRYDQGFGTNLVNISRMCFSGSCPNTKVDDMACEMSHPPHRRCVQCCSEHRCNRHVNSKGVSSIVDSKMASIVGGLLLSVSVTLTETLYKDYPF
ncbi:uncharacterized protein LOC129270059 isoform X1 [Lytechinus pictus]|uniref:uncharacterized protein LOC129270059 isoform X1 n=1 Tax=Lytechinus pictus TaxID=7653 RepID=UPI0030BA036A